MTSLRAPVNGIEIAYETFGDRGDPALVLVMGLGAQMLAWPDELCEALASAGHFVVRFDNRDVGASTHFHEDEPPNVVDVVLRRSEPPYHITDMAADVVGLLDALTIDRAHVVGASMGGFIAQTVALQWPQRVRSLTLIMTSTGSRLVGNPKPRIFSRLLRRRVAADRHEAISATVETFRVIGSKGYAFDEEHLRDLAGRSYDRAYDPAGYLRQLAAISAQPNRTKELAALTVPALVMHGLHDPLVAVSGGLALARTIPRATFVGFAGMGHDLPRPLWPEFVREIVALAARADGRG